MIAAHSFVRAGARAGFLGALALMVGCAAQGAPAPRSEAAEAPGLAPVNVLVEPKPEAAPHALAPAPDYAKLADEIDQHLYREVVDRWYPRIVDGKQGGFGPHQRFDWTPADKNERFLVFQTRMTWLAAEVAARSPERREAFQKYAVHGLDWLEKKQWDAKSGGFFWNMAHDGKPLTTDKHAYGISFGIYATATVAAKLQDERAKALALKTFDWLDKNAHDAKNGGYFEALSREGKPLSNAPNAKQPKDQIGTVYGQKSMNTHIHLLEAFTALYAVAPEARVRQRLEEVFSVVRDKVYDQRGFLNLYFEPDWKPVPGADSYGHDVETGFLLLEAAEALGQHEDPKTLAVARKLVDHAVQYGWDNEFGGFYDQGPIEGAATHTNKIWWTQAEGLNALLLMHELFGARSPEYYKLFEAQWSFITRHQLDKKYGDWYGELARDGKPLHPEGDKGGDWKEAYHQSRALMNSADRLRRLAKR